VLEGTTARATGQRVTTGAALLRHPLLAVATAALVLGPTAAVALAREPIYTAESRLLVGQVDVEAQAVPGFAQATQQLASLYARVVSTDVVVGPVAEELGLDAPTVQGALRASPIPQAAVIRIEAEAGDGAQAVALAEAAALQLQAYVDQLNDTDPTTTPVYEELAAANAELAAADVRVRDLQAQVDSIQVVIGRALAGEVVPQGLDLLRASLDAVQADLVVATTAALQARSAAGLLEDEFEEVARGAGDRAGVEVVGTPLGASSDAAPVRLATLLGGVVGAVLLALGVVTARANLDHLRALRREVRRPRRRRTGGGAPRPRPALSGR
jgi:capsular polysaccharide biosynthesis protein